MRWRMEDVCWDRFESSKLDPGILKAVKTAALVEANSADYVTYLERVFAGDPEVCAAIEQWGIEEKQHGLALGKWAELADPSFDFEKSLDHFRKAYQIPLDVDQSVRGSREGELIARCVVESGTSSFYSALKEATDEPCLKDICAKIARDEFFHYQLFHRYIDRFAGDNPLPLMARLKIALGRVSEAEDEELAQAYYSANIAYADPAPEMTLEDCTRDYFKTTFSLYRFHHIRNAGRMILRAAGLNPESRLSRLGIRLAWFFVKWKTRGLQQKQAFT
ncbi:ferritin-like domain-containing protein [Luteithermobacter gelatinilyticus]|uniref:ferritin-like domain-containing protein n=1 Tax=Luteithermobacter gelatinilyticus TaxID=2582913 RepID=UPI0011058144|nr:ferritin-like domain-containing protein [Luteithermobacter gelatinilyticus]